MLFSSYENGGQEIGVRGELLQWLRIRKSLTIYEKACANTYQKRGPSEYTSFLFRLFFEGALSLCRHLLRWSCQETY